MTELIVEFNQAAFKHSISREDIRLILIQVFAEKLLHRLENWFYMEVS